jgi:hypothetical protein
MNPQELELASKIMGELRNTTGYGYETLVKGTVISGLLDASVIILSVIVASVAGYIAYRHSMKKDNEPRYGDMSPFWCGVVCFIAIGFAALVAFAILSGALMAIFAPEYTVINKIIAKAAGQ